MDVDAVKQRAGYLGTIAVNLLVRATAGMFGVCKIPTRTAMRYRTSTILYLII